MRGRGPTELPVNESKASRAGELSVPALAAVALDQGRPPSFLQVWWLAARPKTLPAAATPVLVGSTCAHASGAFALLPALAALAGALLLQIAANFANDVFDFEKGADTDTRLGPRRVVQAGWVSPGAMRRALVLTLVLALVVGAYLVSVAGPVLIAVGLACMVAAVAYTGGPYPLGYHGLGEVFVLLFFGFVAVTMTSFVQLGHIPPLAWLCSIPVGCLATGILVVNNVRDAETDASAGKRTLAVRFGRAFGVSEYRGLLVVAYAVPLYLAVSGMLTTWALLPWLTLPLAVRLARRIQHDQGRALNASLAGTARLLLLFGALLGTSIIFGSQGARVMQCASCS